MTRVDFETERVTHRVLEFINDSVASCLNAQSAANFHDVIAGHAGASHAAGRHDFTKTAALDVSDKRVSQQLEAFTKITYSLYTLPAGAFSDDIMTRFTVSVPDTRTRGNCFRSC